MIFFSNLIDRASLLVMSLFSGKLKKEMLAEQHRINKAAWREYLKKLKETGGFIENQREMTDFRYGTNKGRIGRKLFNGKEMTGADNTCEVIAVYNAINFLSKGSNMDTVGFPELLRSFSEKGIAFRGMFGTSPGALIKYLKSKGYKVEKLKASKINEENCAALERKYKTFIFSSFNQGQNPFSMIHTMCITKEELGADGGSEPVQNIPDESIAVKKITDDKISYNNISAMSDNNITDNNITDNNMNGIFKVHNDYEGNKTYSSLYAAVSGYNGGKGHPVIIIAAENRTQKPD
ncbi:MAG: hypothetical protein K6C35_08660 [Eubacterium sp.]|nr:hypothetical protein [Eubacterium sp.]